MARQQAKFVLSAPKPALLEDFGLPEFAFIGRSNVGKSSLVGKVLGSPGIVRTSRTPGRTQLLNQFVVPGKCVIVDLPGYGYAKTSKKQRTELAAMVRRYLEEREQLACIFMLVDARRDPVSEYDQYVWNWLVEHRRDTIVVVTKADLLPKTKRKNQVHKLAKQLGAQGTALITSSSKLGEGVSEIWQHMQSYDE